MSIESTEFVGAGGYPLPERPVEGRILVAELAAPAELSETLTQFERGNTLVRDIAGFTTAGRQAVLTAVEQRGGQFTSTEAAICWRAASTLRDAMTGVPPHDEYLQASAGWNFMVNAEGFLLANRPWARVLDAAVQEYSGQGISALLAHGPSPAYDLGLRRLIGEVAAQPHNALSVGYYLAGRSREGENYQNEHFGPLLTEGKQRALRQIDRYANATGLDEQHAIRAKRQVERTQFSAFDHLVQGVTNQYGVDGDHLMGTLRVEAKFNGSPASVQLPEQESARHTVYHELMHASGAQSYLAQGGNRVGLRYGEHGRSVNEAFTEFLTQEALGFPHIEFVTPTSARFTGRHYVDELKAITAVAMRPELFAALYRAYYGQVDDPALLETAINLFTQNLSRARGDQ